MPRPRNPANEPGRMRTEKWRKRLHYVGGFETDAVDSAIAAAVTAYFYKCLMEERSVGQSRVDTLERMAAAYLVAQSEGGADLELALKRVRSRVRREDVQEVAALVFSKSPFLSSLPITPQA